MGLEVMKKVQEEINTVGTSVDTFSEGLVKYLGAMGLPTENVLVDNSERMIVVQTVPHVMTKLDAKTRKESMYISKFMAACGAGLFDAALNFLWNEIIVNLRRKVANFDINYFLDSVIKEPKKRKRIQKEDDLKFLEDWELIEGCKDTGIITEIGYKHLDYIRDMRNHASAAHPNHNDIDGLQLASWLQTCIKEVLAKKPEGAVIIIHSLLKNLRSNVLSEEDIDSVASRLSSVPEELIDSLLKAVFGMYTDKDLDVKIKNNIKMLNVYIWNNSSELAKKNIGLNYAMFSANADIDRKTLAKEFLDNVSGLSYLSEDQKVIDLNLILDSLFSSHYSWNNFTNEALPARQLSKYIPDTGKIPSIIEDKYVKTIINCALGNGYGISESANEYYEEMISKFTEEHFKIFSKLIFDVSIVSKLQNSMCQDRFMKFTEYFNLRAVDGALKDVLEKIIKTPKNKLEKLKIDSEFKEKIKKLS